MKKEVEKTRRINNERERYGRKGNDKLKEEAKL